MRSALTSLARTPGFTALVAVTLALGIGANTAIFSVLNGLVLRSLPVNDPERLALLEVGAAGHDVVTYATWDAIRQRADMFDGVFAWQGSRTVSVARGSDTQEARGFYASGDFFKTLGLQPALGRSLTASDDVLSTAGGPRGRDGAVAMLSYAYWQRRFGGDLNVIGTAVTIEKVPFTIVGVMPRTFLGLEVGRTFDIALPLGTEPVIRGRESVINDALVTHWLHVLFRLKRDQTVESATATIRGLQPQIRDASIPAQFPGNRDEFLKDPMRLVPVATGTSGLRGTYTRPLLIVFALVAVVLLVACADIANLLLARATARRHEMAVRHAVGASPWRLARQVLAEGLLLAGLGAAGGLVFAAWASRALVALVAGGSTLDLSLDWKVLAFTAAVATASALMFATLPAFRAATIAPIDVLKGKRHGDHKGGSGLIVGQVTLSIVLVVVAGLLVRTLTGLISVPLGIDADKVVVTEIDASRSALAPEDRASFYQRLANDVGSTPDVAGAAASIATPLGSGTFFEVIADIPGAAGKSVSKVNFVTPGWFGVFGVPLIAGRDFDARDTRNAASVIVVNEAFVRAFFAGRNPVGQSFPVAAGGGNLPMGVNTVVGVVGDTIAGSLRDGMPPMVYVPIAQWAFPVPMFPRVAISARAATVQPGTLEPRITAALLAADPELKPSADVIADGIAGSVKTERLVAQLSGTLAAVALLLAGMGLYGVTSYGVKRRRTEIGVRMALGARPVDVVALIVGRGVMLTSMGIVAGLACAALVTRYLKGMLFGVAPLDPLTFGAAAVLFLAIAALAALLPARRAARLDPLTALRAE